VNKDFQNEFTVIIHLNEMIILKYAERIRHMARRDVYCLQTVLTLTSFSSMADNISAVD